MAAARRTLPNDYTAQAKAFRSRAVTKLCQHYCTQTCITFVRDLLAPPCNVAVRGKLQLCAFCECHDTMFSSSQLKPLLMPWSCGVWRSTRLVSHTAATPMRGNVAHHHWKQCQKTPVGAQSCSGLMQSSCHKTSSACSVSGNPNVLFSNQHSCHFPPTRVILMSPLITSRCNRSVRGCDASNASSTSLHCNGSLCHCVQLDFLAGTVDSVGYRFRLTSIPCRCKTTPRSRNIETQLPVLLK